MRHFSLLIAILFTCRLLMAQPVNDECQTAFHLPFSDSWCSNPGQFTTVNATPYSGTLPQDACQLPLQSEVWFTFIPSTPAVYIRVSGNINNLGTLRNPAISVFQGNCSTMTRLGCNNTSSITSQVELTVTNLIIGKVYYLVVEGLNQNEGTFQVCLEGFIPPPSPESDCDQAVLLCDKSAFFLDTLLGIGITDPGVATTCIRGEHSSAWYKWTCEVSGTLTFNITPNNYLPGYESDDIDFVLYELPGGLDDCANKRMVRCMASGANTDGFGNVLPFPNWQRCNGPTGLREGDPDIEEPASCMIASQNNYVRALEMEAGKSYALLINNYSQTGLGFSIEWGGTGTFLGPKPDFEVTAAQAFECDKTIIFENQSVAETDSIISWYWSFGAGSSPLFDTTKGPIDVVYESFGAKRATLTVTSSRGCVVTEIVDFFVEPCCADTSTLAVQAIVTDQLCPGTATGMIQGVGISGSPAYQYSLDCVSFQPSSFFPFLVPGDYTLCIQDQKGCQNEIDITVNPANHIGVVLGDTIFVQLGETAKLNAIPFPNLPTGVNWNLPGHLTFNGPDIPSLLMPEVLPPQTAWYVITITTDEGCVATDSVLIVVDPYKPIYIPNVFTPNGDYINDHVTVYGNQAATGVKRLQIFDRWGGMLWERTNFDLNDPLLGWDGTSKGKPVNPGVYTYVAEVEFLDNISGIYHGTITVLQ